MKLFSFLFATIPTFVLALSVSAPIKAQDIDSELSSWMQYANDNSSIADLTIPGTHNSGATYEPLSGTAACQDMSIRAQLDIGVRYLDIRLRHYEDALIVHHGSVYQYLNFDDVLLQVTEFLAENPSEFVIMEILEEYTAENNTRSFEQTFVTYADNPSYSSYWWRHSYVPKVGDVRGKIVLMRRFSGSFSVSGGIDVRGWQDDARFTLYDTRGVGIDVQDYYKVSSSTNDNKWGEIVSQFNDAINDTSGTLFLNYTSGRSTFLGIPNITSVSNDINERLVNYFESNESESIHHGIVISDFITPEMTRAELKSFF